MWIRMRFEEVTERLSVLSIPSMGNMRLWQAVHGGYTWVIAYESGLPDWSDEEKQQHVGYMASYRKGEHHRSSQTIHIEGGPWDSFAKAEEACKRTWKQIRQAN